MTKLLSVAALLLAGFLLTACGDDTDSGATSDAPSSGAQFNDADVEFAQGMIPHHEQAVQMAQLADESAQSPDVKQLAADIESAQAPEIDQLTSWLTEWGQEVPETDSEGGMAGMDHGGASMDMEGLMSAADMEMLMAASGAEFDEMFLQMMIEHHEGAVAMAKTEVAEGEYAEAIEMAEGIITTQEAEIAEMTGLLAS